LPTAAPAGRGGISCPTTTKDARDLLVARKIADTLDALDLRYPRLDPKLREIKIK
jgi:hypothetical protein